jgi:hypothetical protein
MDKRTWAWALLTSLVVILNTPPIFGGDASVQGDGTTTWQAGVDGVEIVWNPDGSIKKIYSRYAQPVEFADRRGISTAQVIAEEKAKGAVVRFMNQAVTSNRLVTEMSTDLNKMTQERETGKAANVKKVDQRTLMTNLTEVTGSFAAGKLKGVIILEKGYDEKAEEAWVMVGISDKTIAAANAAQQMLADSPNKTGPDELKKQPGELRKSKQDF